MSDFVNTKDVEERLARALEQTQLAYMALANARCKEGDVHAVSVAYKRSNEAGHRLDKLRHYRWVA